MDNFFYLESVGREYEQWVARQVRQNALERAARLANERQQPVASFRPLEMVRRYVRWLSARMQPAAPEPEIW